MTYFQFLFLFQIIPIAILWLLAIKDDRQGKLIPEFLNGRAVWIAVGVHVLLALAYTTPWDNYLVATGVWYYDPQRITGVVLGWVPLEEYTFFVVETIFVGLWWWFMARRFVSPAEFRPDRRLRIFSAFALGVIWAAAVALLASGIQPWVYLSLILAWILPPIMLQIAFGADILWYYRKLLLLTVLPIFLYISATDALAIASGIWTIDPQQTLGVLIGPLPVEEALFFLVTVVIVSFGMTLSLALVARERLPSTDYLQRI